MVKVMKITIPKNETLWVTYLTSKGETSYIITSNKDRSNYFLYKVDDSGKLEKIAKSPTPQELYEKVV